MEEEFSSLLVWENLTKRLFLLISRQALKISLWKNPYKVDVEWNNHLKKEPLVLITLGIAVEGGRFCHYGFR